MQIQQIRVRRRELQRFIHFHRLQHRLHRVEILRVVRAAKLFARLVHALQLPQKLISRRLPHHGEEDRPKQFITLLNHVVRVELLRLSPTAQITRRPRQGVQRLALLAREQRPRPFMRRYLRLILPTEHRLQHRAFLYRLPRLRYRSRVVPRARRVVPRRPKSRLRVVRSLAFASLSFPSPVAFSLVRSSVVRCVARVRHRSRVASKRVAAPSCARDRRRLASAGALAHAGVF